VASADHARTNMALIMPEMIDQVPGAALRAAVTLRLAMEVSCGVYIPSTAIKWLPGCLCKTLAYHHESRSHILALVKKRWTSSSSTSASSALSTAGPATHHSAPGEAARQVSSAPRSIDALRVSGLGEDDPVSWLPQPDDPVDSFQDDDVGERRLWWRRQADDQESPARCAAWGRAARTQPFPSGRRRTQFTHPRWCSERSLVAVVREVLGQAVQ